MKTSRLRNRWYIKQRILMSIFLVLHKLPRPILHLWQLYHLKNLIKMAWTSVPFYKDLYTAHGIETGQPYVLADLKNFPLVDKRVLKKEPLTTFLNPQIPEQFHLISRTSGSTGEPVSVVKDTRQTEIPYTFPFLLWRELSSKIPNIRGAALRVNNRPVTRQFLHLPVKDLRDNPDALIEKLVAFKPDYLDGRATGLTELARQIALRNFSITIPFITSHGETLRDFQRTYIEAVFHGEVFNRYGLEEGGDVATECFIHEGMHIQENKAIVEIVGDDGISLLDGRPGRIVVTNITSKLMPFIRYDTGDRGYIIPDKCECGISFRRLQVLGRKYGGFFALGGKKYHIGELEVFMTKLNYPILRYQVAQQNDSLEIRLIPARPLRKDELVGIQTECALAFGFLPSIRIVEKLPFSESGKTPFIANDKDIVA